MLILKNVLIVSLVLMLSGCSVSANSSKSNGIVKNIDQVEGEGWHFFHRSRSYR